MSATKKVSGVRRIGGAVHLGSDYLVIPLPTPHLVRLVARSVLLVAAVFSFTWIRTAFLRYGDEDRSFDAGASFPPNFIDLLGRRGLLRSEDNDFFLRDAIAKAATSALAFPAAAEDFERADHAASASMVATQKNSDVNLGRRLRRLLAVPVAKKEALSKLEEVLLEPPGPGRRGWKRKARYLPDLTGDSLDEYPRRVFVEVVPTGGAGSGAAWFERNYPMKGRAFEVIRVEVDEEEEVPAEMESEGGRPSLAEWLEGNVKEEEYVVVKAEAASVEEVVAEGVIGLVDELFLECDHQMGEGEENEWRKGRRRAYWECLALYGKLRDAGVAVHQWWSF
ncbi:uncharacterized protein LOC122004621 [Zingiber officinale]|uniref:DUF7870 domain-containing protein n=1 Tax=Zingiber officinale TaxID=94328 RepID=A0A8J5FL84_ZINOF|nr:uncharacterized protein LOC122004621 [Zingiber officinale]KAG6490567.1 hypothetical protein ZIOFF_051866 [Zingiber officinale]